MANVKMLQEMGNQIAILLDDGTKLLCYPTGNGIWLLGGAGGPGPSENIADTISPGHSITNPGGTVAAGWQWHLDNNGGRGGVDFNYNFDNILAPAAGTVSHFDVSGVGMVIKLVLDEPVNRINSQLTNDAYGPMTAIWFQHCSSANDGHVEQGDIIGVSGDGYGAYDAHLHVHGQINNANSSGSSVRCNFWGFV